MKTLFRIFLILVGLFVAGLVFLSIVLRDRRPEIYFAAENGDTNRVAQYLSEGHDINGLINSHHTVRAKASLLHIAIHGGQIEMIEFLLSKGADPNQPGTGQPALMWTLGGLKNNEVPRARRLQMLRQLLKAGANPNAKESSEYCSTPLMKAARFGDVEIVRTLLEAGADLNATNKVGWTALHVADNAETVKLLLAAGANPNARDSTGETPAKFASRNYHWSALSVLTNVASGQEK